MNDLSALTNHFLIAMPSMSDPNFANSVIYICEHNKQGATGIIINKPVGVQLQEVFEQMQIKCDVQRSQEIPILFGGPVHPERGFVIHRPQGKWRTTLEMDKEISITTSQDVLDAIALGKGPDDLIVALGYTGWDSSQLEEEVAKNAWLTCPADPDILYKTPFADRWKAAINLMGIDISNLSSEEGHA